MPKIVTYSCETCDGHVDRDGGLMLSVRPFVSAPEPKLGGPLADRPILYFCSVSCAQGWLVEGMRSGS